MSSRLAILLVAAVAPASCTCTVEADPRDAGGGADAADSAADGPIDAALDAPPIDWPDASWEEWICHFPGPCPFERPFCCANMNKGSDVCEATGQREECIEWPDDGTALRVGCSDPGTQCPAGHPFCCVGPDAVCAERELEGWTCALEE